MGESDYPVMHKVRQEVIRRPLPDVGRSLDEGFGQAAAAATFEGPRIAVAVGSRSFDRAAEVVKLTLRKLRAEGLQPFVLPAMGSHGGGTPEGRLEVLEGLGITLRSTGFPFEPSGQTVEVGKAGSALAFTSTAALQADGIVLVNRVAPHTGFSGRVQSGVAKMLVVGLGQVEGAAALHAHGFGAGHLIAELAGVILASCPPAVAVAAVEDGAGLLSHLEVMPGGSMLEREPGLLALAASTKPRIPVDGADLLIVDEMGKDISGAGFDTKVIGRIMNIQPAELPVFCAKLLIALRLTAASMGNATGIGHADFTTRALADAIDPGVTARNVETSGALERAVLPPVATSERDAVRMALADLGAPAATEARVVRIRNTRSLAELEVSAPLAAELAGSPGVTVEAEGRPMSFDSDGNLEPG